MTNKIVLRTTEQFMSDYTPIYKPIYPLFLGGKSQQYAAEVGQMDFRRIETVGDIRAKHITPKDTEIRQLNVTDGKKSYKKYFLANQFTVSNIQNREGFEEVVAQVLDEHQVQADELFLTGEGTNNNNVINNGLFYSGDTNYSLLSSKTIPVADRLHAFHTEIVTTAAKAKQVAGQKVVVLYGQNTIAQYNSLFQNSDTPVKRVIQEVLGNEFSIVELPEAPTPAGTEGWIVANLDQTKLHYSKLPELLSQGNNDEKMYLWANFMMGSFMLEVLAKDGIIHQPVTFAAP